MSGLIGGIARREPESDYPLRALNRSSQSDVECHSADIGDLDAILPAFDGIDNVVKSLQRPLFGAVKSRQTISSSLRTNSFPSARDGGVQHLASSA